MSDLELLRDMFAVREVLAIEPRTFDMAWWRVDDTPCGTTLCLAGHLAVLRGFRFEPSISSWLGGERDLPLSFFESTLECGHWLWQRVFWPLELRALYASNPVAAGQQAIDLWASQNYTPEEIAEASATYQDRLEDLTAKKREVYHA